MIKNEREFKITRVQAEKFAGTLRQLDGSSSESSQGVTGLQRTAIRSMLDELEEELREYERLKSGQIQEFVAESIADLPRVLIQARIARGLTHKQLADKIGVKEQQIQRYEASDYESASLKRLKELADALDVSLVGYLSISSKASTWSKILGKLKRVGIDPQLVMTRILPTTIVHAEHPSRGEHCDWGQRAKVQASELLSRIFGFEPTDVLCGDALNLQVPVGVAPRFKAPVSASDRRLAAWTLYAHYLVELLHRSITWESAVPVEYPSTPEAVRAAIFDNSGMPAFESVLSFVWRSGVAVIPLPGSGGFYGACWRIDRRNYIALKRKAASPALWMHDLLHEYWHAIQESQATQRSRVELEDLLAMDEDSPEQDEEYQANDFAAAVLLNSREEELAQECVDEASGSVERLKAIVPRVANRHNVNGAVLANYMAYRLNLQGINWWGAASNLQTYDEDPFELCSSWLANRVDWSKLDSDERGILSRAVSHMEG